MSSEIARRHVGLSHFATLQQCLFNAAAALVQGKISARLVLSKTQLLRDPFLFPSLTTVNKRTRKKKITKEESDLKDNNEKCRRKRK